MAHEIVAQLLHTLDGVCVGELVERHRGGVHRHTESKPIHHVVELKNRSLNSSDTAALCRDGNGAAGKTGDEERDRQGGRFNERERTGRTEVRRGAGRDKDMMRESEKDIMRK